MKTLLRKINSLEIVKEHYQNIKGKFKSTQDTHEKTILFKRLVNLAGVMQFLISISKNT
jgi:predicted nuclease with TOPRIM domain